MYLRPGFNESLDACALDLLREREELVARIQADLDRVDAIDTMVRGFRAVVPCAGLTSRDGGALLRVGSGLLVAGT